MLRNDRRFKKDYVHRFVQHMLDCTNPEMELYSSLCPKIDYFIMAEVCSLVDTLATNHRKLEPE